MNNYRSNNLRRVLLLSAILFGGVIILYKAATRGKPNVSDNNLIVSDNEIRFAGKLLESPESLPYIFLEAGLELGGNSKYTYSILDRQNSENQLLRVDKLVLDAGSFSSRVTAFYLYNQNSGEYKRVLQSTKDQNKARYPETEIVFRNPLTVRFYYDVSRPLGCYGQDCRSYWADHYRWDSGQGKFVEIDREFIDFYRDLLKKYEAMNASGCDLGNAERKQLEILEELYISSETNYCIDTTGPEVNKREDLNRFFEYREKISKLVESNVCNTQLRGQPNIAVERLEGTPKPVDFKTFSEAQTFYTMITKAVSSGPNFAGHFTLASWGCGTDCYGYAVVDARTGKIVAYSSVNEAYHLGNFDINSRILISEPVYAGQERKFYRVIEENGKSRFELTCTETSSEDMYGLPQ